MSSRFTTCVCNFQRPDKLKRVLESLHNDHPIVVATYGSTPENVAIVESISPCIPHFYTSSDHGCNQLWYQAVKMARTKWVSILYDDDLRPPGFADEVDKLISMMEASGAGFAAWNAVAYHWHDGSIKQSMEIAAGTTGIHPTRPLLRRVTTPNRFPDSPVSFLYDRETVLDILAWCETNLADCVTRPTMMIGNDLALFYGHIRRFSTMVQSNKPLSLYGNWNGSETCRYFTKESTPLMKMYERARWRLIAQNAVIFPPKRTSGINGINDL